MKRFHVHIAVESIEASVNFYNKLLGQPPTVSKSDYAKWMLDDPRINFAISQRSAHAGVTGLDHLGFQLDSSAELHAMTAQLQAADVAVTDMGETTCCYAKSDKGWVHDPQGIAWESFVTLGESTRYGTENATDAVLQTSGACCAPIASAISAAPAAKPKISLKEMGAVSANSCAAGSAKAAGSSCC